MSAPQSPMAPAPHRNHFAQMVAHDLSAPVRLVQGHLQLLVRRYGDALCEDALDHLRIAQEGASRLQASIDGHLALLRLDRNDGFDERVLLDDVVDTVRLLLAPQLEGAGGQLFVSGELPAVSGHEALLVVLMQNLVGNAVRHRGDEPPRVRVSAERHGERCVLRVRDNGRGVQPDQVRSLLQLGVRGEDSSGHGVGLATCARVVERHGGTLRIEPLPLGGTEARFDLACAEVA